MTGLLQITWPTFQALPQKSPTETEETIKYLYQDDQSSADIRTQNDHMGEDRVTDKMKTIWLFTGL